MTTVLTARPNLPVVFASGPVTTSPAGPWRLAWRRFRRHRLAIVGMVVIAFLASASLLADVLSPYNPTKTNLLEMLDAPSVAHPMGTDELGRDLMARILHGGRVSLAVGVLAVALAVSIGSTVGAIAGYRGGWVQRQHHTTQIEITQRQSASRKQKVKHHHWLHQPCPQPLRLGRLERHLELPPRLAIAV